VKSRYRRVSTRLHGDAGFRSLSPLEPSGQALWMYLLTYPGFTAIPGLFRDRREGMAANLGWPLDVFDRCWREISGEAMADDSPTLLPGVGNGRYGVPADKPMAHADWSAGVIWLPNAIKHNLPESMNVLKSWATFVDQIPECLLKARAILGTHRFLASWKDGFATVYREYFHEAIIEAIAQIARDGNTDDRGLADRLASRMASGNIKPAPTRRHPGRHADSDTESPAAKQAARDAAGRFAASHAARLTVTPAPAPAPAPTPSMTSLPPSQRDVGHDDHDTDPKTSTDANSPTQKSAPNAQPKRAPRALPNIADAEKTCTAWIETGLWHAQDRADAKATEHVTTTIAGLVRDFGDTLAADCTRAYDRWRRDTGSARVRNRKRHDKAVSRWAGKEAEKMRARGEIVGGPPPPTSSELDQSVADLERKLGR